MPDAATLAIEEALKQNWEKAIAINRQILKENPSDIEALNRLAFALTQIGLIKEAKQVYNKVLRINRFNAIAIKNLKRLSLLTSKSVATNARKTTQAQRPNNNFVGLFLEEVGRTKVVTLINLAEAKIVTLLHPTDPVLLVPRRRGVSVTTSDGVYIGALPDDIARRLFFLIRGGNRYSAYVKSADRNSVSVFIKELQRHGKFRNQPSFLGKGGSYYPFVRDEAFSNEGKPDVSRLEDLEEEGEEGKEEAKSEEEAES